MDSYSDYRDIYSEVELFLKDHHLDNIEVSIRDDEFQHISLKLSNNESFDPEELLNYIDQQNESRFYIVSTLVSYSEIPTLKKYYIPHKRLNDFLYVINDPEYDEHVISIDQAVDQ